MCGNCNVISLAAAPFDKKATNKFILNRHRWGPSLVASSQWGVFLGFHLWGPVIWYSVNVQNQVGSIKLSGQVLLMCSVCCCISERTTQYDMHVCWGHTPTDFPSADIVCRLTAGLIARLQGFGCCTLPLAPRWVGTVIQCLLMLRRLPAYRLPGHRATQTVYTVWIAFLWRACWWKDKKKKKEESAHNRVHKMHCQVVVLLDLFERVTVGVSCFIHDISPFKARISGRGSSVALCPSFWLSFSARADRTEPAGFALCGSLANVCMDVSYWLDCTLRPTLPRTTVSC